MYFRVKDKELAKKALERVLLDISKNPQHVLKKPNTMTFEEKLAYAEAKNKYVGSMSQAINQVKGKSK